MRSLQILLKLTPQQFDLPLKARFDNLNLRCLLLRDLRKIFLSRITGLLRLRCGDRRQMSEHWVTWCEWRREEEHG